MKVARFSLGDDVKFGVVDGSRTHRSKRPPYCERIRTFGRTRTLKEGEVVGTERFRQKSFAWAKTICRTSTKWVLRQMLNLRCF
jgi:hypothetical protein